MKAVDRSKIGSAVRNSELREKGSDPDPVHRATYRSFAAVSGKGGANISGPYEPVLGWPQPIHPGEWRTGSGRGVIALSPDRVLATFGGEIAHYEDGSVWGVDTFRDLRFTEVNARKGVTHRHCHELVVFDRDGRLSESWDRWLDAFHENDVRDGRRPKAGHINRIRVSRYDPDGHVWVVGMGNTGIFKLTADGQHLLMKIDADNVPERLHPYVYAQDIAFLPDGDLIVGHLHHVMRFSKDGEFKSAVGGQGRGPGEFDGLHDVQVHPKTLDLYVNDRVNNRIQILDPSGRFKDEWPAMHGVYSIRFTADGEHVWAGNGFVNKFFKYDTAGRLIREATWGTFGIAPGAIWCPHGFDTDSEGNLYVAEDYSGRIQKLRPLRDADPHDPQLIGPLCV